MIVLKTFSHYTFASNYIERFCMSDDFELKCAKQEICEKQRKNHQGNSRTRCDFQQFQVYKGGE